MPGDKRASCGERIALALNIRGIKQIDLSTKTGIPKSAISQYISGEFKPKQDRIYLIARTLNVDEAWLMGYDVPMEPQKENTPDKQELTESELLMLKLFRAIPTDRQPEALELLRAALKMMQIP